MDLSPEMDTFPILRPDLIPLLSKDWLARSQAALVPLIASLREEVRPLVHLAAVTNEHTHVLCVFAGRGLRDATVVCNPAAPASV